MKSYITLIIVAMALTGCSSLKAINKSLNEESRKSHCINIPEKKIATDFDKIRNIAIEEAKNNGFEEMTNEYKKPSKHNGWKGQMSFYHQSKYQIGSEYLKLTFDNNSICFRTDAAEADGKAAITAMKERISKL